MGVVDSAGEGEGGAVDLANTEICALCPGILLCGKDGTSGPIRCSYCQNVVIEFLDDHRVFYLGDINSWYTQTVLADCPKSAARPVTAGLTYACRACAGRKHDQSKKRVR